MSKLGPAGASVSLSSPPEGESDVGGLRLYLSSISHEWICLSGGNICLLAIIASLELLLGKAQV